MLSEASCHSGSPQQPLGPPHSTYLPIDSPILFGGSRCSPFPCPAPLHLPFSLPQCACVFLCDYVSSRPFNASARREQWCSKRKRGTATSRGGAWGRASRGKQCDLTWVGRIDMVAREAHQTYRLIFVGGLRIAGWEKRGAGKLVAAGVEGCSARRVCMQGCKAAMVGSADQKQRRVGCRRGLRHTRGKCCWSAQGEGWERVRNDYTCARCKVWSSAGKGTGGEVLRGAMGVALGANGDAPAQCQLSSNAAPAEWGQRSSACSVRCVTRQQTAKQSRPQRQNFSARSS